MDILLFIFGIFCLYRQQYAYVLTIIVLLTSSYLQLPIVKDNFFHNFLFPHNVWDTGLLLYLLFFTSIARKKGFTVRHPATRYIHLFFAFLFFNGLYDISLGTSVMDVIKYWRYWFLLSIVYIAPYIKREIVLQSFKQIFTLTLWCCVLILFQHYTPIRLVEMKELISVGRGVKPPSFSIYCAVLCLINFWKQGMVKRTVYFFIIITPTILCMKMTYTISVIGIYLLYIFVSSSWSSSKKIALSVTFMLCVACFLSYDKKFSSRLIEMTQEIHTIENNEISGNFSYRIMHTHERLDYIITDPVRIVRGAGYMAEQNLKNELFSVGLYDTERDRITQLDTADITWSILFIRLGIGGTIIFLLFYLKIVRLYYSRMKENELNIYFFSMTAVFLIFTSLGNTLIAEGDFYLYPLLFLATVQSKGSSADYSVQGLKTKNAY